jgi:hypothetical protein
MRPRTKLLFEVVPELSTSGSAAGRAPDACRPPGQAWHAWPRLPQLDRTGAASTVADLRNARAHRLRPGHSRMSETAGPTGLNGTSSVEAKARPIFTSAVQTSTSRSRYVVDMALPFRTARSAPKTCKDNASLQRRVGVTDVRVRAPRSPAGSVLSFAPKPYPDGIPTLGSAVLETVGPNLVNSWIGSLAGCP